MRWTWWPIQRWTYGCHGGRHGGNMVADIDMEKKISKNWDQTLLCWILHQHAHFLSFASEETWLLNVQKCLCSKWLNISWIEMWIKWQIIIKMGNELESANLSRIHKIILHLKWWLWFYDSKDNGYKLLYCLNGLHVSVELEHWECDCGKQQPENEF